AEEEMLIELETELLNNSTKKDKTTNTNWKTKTFNNIAAHYPLKK
ncbi:20981_t:CDS:1, partial [Cetraspora pellucida]